MGRFKSFPLGSLAIFVFLHLVHGQLSQQGFISIDCGSNSSYTEPITTLNYVSDSDYVDSGTPISIASNNISATLLKQLWNLRSFPQGARNCYNVDVKIGVKYLIRASFLYGNYDGKNNVPAFDLYLGTNFWVTVQLQEVQSIVHKEIIHTTTSNRVQVCLVNNGNGIPFISALEFRPLANGSYVTVTGSIESFLRLDFGDENNNFTRFPDDIYDRIWSPLAPLAGLTSIKLNSSFQVNNEDPLGFKAPSVVLSTASTVINESAPMDLPWAAAISTDQYYAYLYFAELKQLQANESRLFKVFINDKLWLDGDVPINYLSENIVYSLSPLPISPKYEFKLVRSVGSTLPPIINAIEIYIVKNFDQSTTEEGDVDAIESIKLTYEVTKNWQGDPCVPIEFAWQGLSCSNSSSTNPPRITGLDLSSNELTGEIAANISKLTKLEVLDLSNNSLSGPVPDFLAGMASLRVLNLSGNNLSGQIPAALINKRGEGSLQLSLDGNPNLIVTASSEKKSNIVIPIVAAVGGVVIISILILVSFYFLRRKKNLNATGPVTTGHHHSPQNFFNLQSEPFASPNRQYSYSDILKITKNFGKLLGEGGFGKVYYGRIGDAEVAVKMLSPKSAQGYKEFQAEVDLLLRVHHRNLTSLVGYCNEGETKMGLLYEYMGRGNLGSILLGENGEFLTWKDRLQIALDSAQGLEYLHSGCRPPIIHRDIKSSNILLNEQLQAKLADFGLSRAFPVDGGTTHVTTKVVGTPGYLDPEYYTSFRLTEKSDIFSFGIVILEVVTGRPVLVRTSEKSHIIQWVDSIISQGDINSVIDPKIKEGSGYNINSVWKAVEVAMSCTVYESANRPSMSHVVNELKECLNLEMNQRRGYQVDSIPSISSSTFDSELGPMPR